MAENLWLNTYKMMDTSKRYLKECGFRWHSSVTDQNTSNYIYSFPLVKYKKHPCVICEIVATQDTGEVIFNVYNSKHNTYFPFYNNFSLYKKLKNKLNRKIETKFEELGIVKL